MQAASTRVDGSDRETRFRLVSLETPAGLVEFGGGLACIRTTEDARSRIATAIAGAVIGPRLPDVDGTVEIAGRYVTLHLLPSPLLHPSARATVDASLLDDFWRETCAQRRSELESAHENGEAERTRVDDAITLAGERIAVLAAATAQAQAPPTVDETPAVDEVADRLEALSASLAELGPVPVPAALALADALDALAAEPEPTPDAAPEIDLPRLERRVAEARIAVAHAAGGVIPAAQTRIESCHRAVVEAERNLFEAGRRERPAALKRYQEALSEERASLAEAGVESYASYLVAIAAGFAPVDIEVRLRAELELAQAEAARDEARGSRERAAGQHADRERELRADAVALLGRMPGDDPAADLRALREEHPDAAPAREELRAVLASVGVDGGDDPVATAHEIADIRRAAPAVVSAPVEPVVEMSDAEQRLRAAVIALERERGMHQTTLDEIDVDLAILEAQQALTVTDLDLHAVTVAVDSLLERYRAAELLAGRLPVILDGALDDLDETVVEGLARHLADVDDVQVIVVTARASVGSAMAAVSASTIVWPTGQGGSAIDELSEREDGMWCGSHLASSAIAMCAHCERPACLECLVYVPGEPELWCVDCVEAQQTPNLRLLRRRRP